MTGTGDHLNIRRPMQWTNGSHAGFSSTTPWQNIGSNFSANNVSTMDENPNSILRHYKKLISIRNAHEALRRGQTLLLENTSDEVFSFARIHEDDAILVISNTGTAEMNPSLTLSLSALPPGQYYLTELLENEAFGQITINADGGFSGLQISGQSLSARESWIILVSVENPISSMLETKPSGRLRLTPNPAQDYFQIERTDGAFDLSFIRVFSADGRLIYQNVISSDELQINTASWHAGVYLVHLSDGKETFVERLILQKE
jgi:hypothetical protein